MQRGLGCQRIRTTFQIAFQHFEMDQSFAHDSDREPAFFHLPDLSFFELDGNRGFRARGNFHDYLKRQVMRALSRS
jgi:hypothetical protein